MTETIQSLTADVATLLQQAAEKYQSAPGNAVAARQLDGLIVQFLRVLADERQDWSQPHTWAFQERLHRICLRVVTEGGLHSSLAIELRSLAAGLAEEAAVLWEDAPARPADAPVFLESIEELERQKVPVRQICKMYGQHHLSLPDAMAYVDDLKAGRVAPPPRRVRERNTGAALHPGLIHFCGSILPA